MYGEIAKYVVVSGELMKLKIAPPVDAVHNSINDSQFIWI